MEYETIYKKAVENNGLTITKELQEINKNEGFMVSIMGLERTFETTDKENIIKTIKEYQKGLKNNDFIGLWVDNGLFYVDISRHYLKKDKAILKGIKEKQLAIYDLKNKNNIYLTKKAYIVYKYNKLNNDLEYLKEFYNIKDIKQAFKLENLKSVYNYIVKDIEDAESYNNLLNNKYIIITENIPISEF